LFDYTHAIVRKPGMSVVSGLREGGGRDPDFDGLQSEHRAYVAALRSLGLIVEELAPAEDFPDSIFVEDPALVFAEGAIILNLAAPSRAGEAAMIAPELENRFDRVLHMTGPGHADGGDVLVLPNRVLIGLSGRTDRAGAEELAGLLAQLGKCAEIAQTPKEVLHFKTGCSLIEEETVFVLPQMADLPVFSGLKVVRVPETEANAANILRIGNSLLIGDSCPKSRAIFEDMGLNTIALPIQQISRIDAGLTCMSLRWRQSD
jgi:dimethylargininase